MTRRPLCALPILASLLLAAVVAAAPFALAAPAEPAAAASAAAPPASFQFERLNRTFRMEDSTIDPITQGPVTVNLQIPASALILKGHSLVLSPLGDGSYRADVGVDFLGKGDLVADFVMPTGASSRMEDTVVAPRQTVRLTGRVRFARVPGGWDVTALHLPPKITVAIQSQVANGLISMCDQMAILLGMDCDGLADSLTNVAVDLPKSGSVFFLPEAELAPAEIAALDAYLGR